MVKSVCWGVGVVRGGGGGGGMEGSVKLPAATRRCWGYEKAL